MRESVMVIEDEKEIRELIRYNLERAGFRVLVVADGEEGVRQAFASRPDAVDRREVVGDPAVFGGVAQHGGQGGVTFVDGSCPDLVLHYLRSPTFNSLG